MHLLVSSQWMRPGLKEASGHMADHYRAASDMFVKWPLSESKHCNVEIGEWFPCPVDRQNFLTLLDLGRSRLPKVGRLEKLEAWLNPQ